MHEQRRHQRIRFSVPPKMRIGFDGQIGKGEIENLSLSGLMVRTDLPLETARQIGCEFRVFDSPVIDVPATVVTRVGNLFGVRFQPGPISQIQIEDAIASALAAGKASILSVHEVGAGKTMRVVGGLTGALRNDFMHALTRVGVEELDVSSVTAVDPAGLSLCLVAVERHGVRLGEQSACFSAAWQDAKAAPGRSDATVV